MVYSEEKYNQNIYNEGQSEERQAGIRDPLPPIKCKKKPPLKRFYIILEGVPRPFPCEQLPDRQMNVWAKT